MRYSLRTLLIVMLLLGPLCAWGWKKHQARLAELERQRTTKALLKDGWISSLGLSGNNSIACEISCGSYQYIPERDPTLDLTNELIQLPTDPFTAVTLQQLVEGISKQPEPMLIGAEAPTLE